MALPREYRKFIGNYDACKSAYGRKCFVNGFANTLVDWS